MGRNVGASFKRFLHNPRGRSMLKFEEMDTTNEKAVS
jgi:hypothetical protein